MPLDDKQREEKEAYAKKIMAEMKLKNEKLQERYREVQRDRERAEERNSSITTGRNQKREADRDIAPKAKYEREWDRGKPNPDTVDWDSSEHHDYYSRNTRSYSDRRYKKEDSWRSRAANSSNNPTSSFFSKYNRNEATPESSTFRNETNFNSRSRSQFQSTNPIRGRATTESSYQNSKHDHSRNFSAPQNYGESKEEPVQHCMDNGMDELMWQCGSMNEVQHKLSRIENWVKSININHGFAESGEMINKKEEYKSRVKRYERSSRREKPNKYAQGEDSGSKRSKEQTYFRAKEKSEQRFNASFSRGSGNRMFTGDRCSSLSDSKNQRDGKWKNLNERTRRKCESDMSDRASSMKESDDPDWGKDKIIQARSNSKSSENSCSRDKRIHHSEEPNPDPWDDYNLGNLKSGELPKFQADEENETSRQSDLKRNFLQDNKCKYGSLPSYDDSGNYEFESHGRQRQSFKKVNNNYVKDCKFCENEVESGLASSSGDFNSRKQSLCRSNCPKFDCDQNSIKSSDPDLKNKYYDHELISPSYVVPPETVQNSESECQITDNWSECNVSKKSDLDNLAVSKPRNIRVPNVQSTDCVEFNPQNSAKYEEVDSNNSADECPRIISSTFDNSFLQCDINSDIYRKNLESAENIIIALQCNPKDCVAPHKRKVSVKRYSHKKTHNKTVKLPLKSKLPLDVKVADECSEKRINSKSFAKDSHSDLETYDKDVDKPNVKLVPERKLNLTDGTKLDPADVPTSNLSDEWATTDEEENEYILLAD